MATDSSRSKKHHSDRHRREKRDRHDRDNDNDDDNDGHDDGHDDGGSSRDQRRERRRSKKTKKGHRDDERHKRSRNRSRTHSHRDYSSDSDGENDGSDVVSNSNHDNDKDKDKSRSKRGHRDRYRRKESDKKRKKSSSSRSGHHNRNRYSDDDDDSDSDDYYSDDSRSRSRDRKKKSKKKKSKSQGEKDKKAKAPPKKNDKSTLFPMGEPLGHPPDLKINAEKDYFSYHQEFWVYLFREEGTYFNDIETKESHAAFARFAKQYNAGKLEEPYYKRKFPNEVIEESKTTKHSWGFKTTDTERKGLGDLQKGVRRQTEYSSQDKKVDSTNININTNTNTNSSGSGDFKNQMGISQTKTAPSVSARRRQTPEERLEERRANQRLKEKVRLTHEELTGGSKDFKERRLEKKREKSTRIHGAHRDNEGGAAGMELSDAALFGGDDKSTLARNRQNKDRRDDRRKNRIEELELKEKERQNNMLKMLGLENLQGRKKLEIAPRKDPP